MTPGVKGVLGDSLRGRGRELRGLIAWSVVQGLPALLSGRFVAEAIDHGFLAHRTGEGLAWLAGLAVTLLVGAWGSREAFRKLAPIVEPFRDSLVRAAVRTSLRNSACPGARPDTGAVARLTRHIEIAREAYASVFMVVLTFVVATVSAVVGLVSLIPIVLVLVLPPLFAGLGLFLGVLRRTASRRRVALIAEEHIAERTSELASAVRDVVASGAEDVVFGDASEAIESQARAAIEVARFTSIQTLAIALGGWLPIILILAFGSWLKGNGATAGVIVGALTYVLQGLQPALQTLIRGIGSNGMWLLVSLDRIVEAIGEGTDRRTEGPSTLSNADGSGGKSALKARPDVKLHGVTFGYGTEPIVDDMSLSISFGDHLAIVGPSGVGKSTLTLLLSGLLIPNSGEVLIGDAPTTSLDAEELAGLRTLIPQEAYLFAGTLWENLVYLHPRASEREVDAAVTAMGLGEVAERVGGYGGDVSDVRLSAGERQLVALARSYLSGAPLVILDEATCHLDPVAEARAERAFAKRRRTLVVVAHRISSARRARRILVMDGDRTLVGTHDSLVRESPLYCDLVGHWTVPVSNGAVTPAG